MSLGTIDHQPRYSINSDATPREAEISLVGLASVMRAERRLIVGVVGFALLAAIVSGALAGGRFTATSAFTPQTPKPSSNLLGVAAQLGVTVAPADAALSPAFYVDLLQTNALLTATVVSPFHTGATGAATQTLVEYYGLGSNTDAASRSRAVDKLRRMIDASVAAKTGVIELAVTAKQPVLAKEINVRLLALLDSFNLQTRKTQASAERAFTQQRVLELRDELRAAEDQLQAFLQRNRGDLRGSPELTFTQERLSREVALRSQVYSSLVQSYEQARIEEVRDTPVLTIVDPPVVPARADSRQMGRRAGVGLLLGAFLGLVIAFVRATLRGIGSPEPETPTR